MAIKNRKTRMYEPWGYIDENNYQGGETILDNEMEKFFSEVSYNKDDNKIHFLNKDGEEKGTIDVSEFVDSGSIIEDVTYSDGILTIKFTNGEKVEINIGELIEENEFTDGLVINDHVVKILIDSTGEPYLSVSEDGLKISGVDEAINVEKERAEAAETALSERIEEIISGSPIQKLDELIEKLGYKNNDTLETTNEHEVAFGEYNVSHTGDDPSQQTIFSIGNGTSDNDRSNALEVRKNGDVFLLIEGEVMNINVLLGQIAHEIYD